MIGKLAALTFCSHAMSSASKPGNFELRTHFCCLETCIFTIVESLDRGKAKFLGKAQFHLASFPHFFD